MPTFTRRTDMPSIIVISGPNEGDYYPLGKRTMVVGRDEGCAIQILDDLVSRKHVQVRFDESAGHYLALDMKSANGAFVNGRRLSAEVGLQDGDILELGKSRLMYTDENFADRESAMNHYKKRGERARGTLVQGSG